MVAYGSEYGGSNIVVGWLIVMLQISSLLPPKILFYEHCPRIIRIYFFNELYSLHLNYNSGENPVIKTVRVNLNSQ